MDHQISPLVFWQPCLSIHQTPLLEMVAEKWAGDVYLVVDRKFPMNRVQNAGWAVEAPRGVFVSTSGANLPEGAIHIVSGLYGPGQWRRHRKNILRENDAKVWVAAESLETGDGTFRVAARFARHGFARFKLRRRLAGFLAIGEAASEQARILGVPRSRIFPFCYVTRPVLMAGEPKIDSSSPQTKSILFIGRIEKAKGADLLFSSELGNGVRVRVIGDHSEKDLEIPTEVEYLGVVSNDRVFSELSAADVLILPSRYDGWGAVVNEALTVGTPVICSKNCGAAELVKGTDPYRGEIIEQLSPTSIEEAVRRVLDSTADRASIRQWSQDAISPDAVSDYLLSLLNGRETSPPWEA